MISAALVRTSGEVEVAITVQVEPDAGQLGRLPFHGDRRLIHHAIAVGIGNGRQANGYGGSPAYVMAELVDRAMRWHGAVFEHVHRWAEQTSLEGTPQKRALHGR